MRTTLRPALLLLAWVDDKGEQKLEQHTSSKHVDCLGRVGLGTCFLSARTLCACVLQTRLTNGADDGTAAELALGNILSVELREPLGSGAASLEVCNCVGHLVCIWWICEVVRGREGRKGKGDDEQRRRGGCGCVEKLLYFLASAG